MKDQQMVSKETYVSPQVVTVHIEFEGNIAAESITVKESNNRVEESWMEAEDDVRDTKLDFFN